ncbi:hypothetical protein BASA50_010545 [Batrachochytrium salamandrivorans]|uniref:TRP C-terminal domain-containing protein n=1 Tax=Batrachochytrium salamandrivorans TaxID=1357716 RepID=A0ABQ8EYM4_9FUNG|nr:hypothetical protein BASA60_010723 [Batrachochytrium salamandrivorans]KAH6588675.1 hypothetical protein BASA50_010545 [Batrachochytrium salamandrivorans]
MAYAEPKSINPSYSTLSMPRYGLRGLRNMALIALLCSLEPCAGLVFRIPSFNISSTTAPVRLTSKAFGFLTENLVKLTLNLDTAVYGNLSNAAPLFEGIFLAICSSQESIRTGRNDKRLYCDRYGSHKAHCGEIHHLTELQPDPDDPSALSMEVEVPTGFRQAYIVSCIAINKSRVLQPTSNIAPVNGVSNIAKIVIMPSITHHSAVSRSLVDLAPQLLSNGSWEFSGSGTLHFTNILMSSSELSLEDITILISSIIFISLWFVGMVKWYWCCIMCPSQFKSVLIVQLFCMYSTIVFFSAVIRIVSYLRIDPFADAVSSEYIMAIYVLSLIESFFAILIQLMLSKGVSIVRRTLTFVERNTIAVLLCASLCTNAIYRYELPGAVFGALAMTITIYVALACNIRHVMAELERHITSLKATATTTYSDTARLTEVMNIIPSTRGYPSGVARVSWREMARHRSRVRCRDFFIAQWKAILNHMMLWKATPPPKIVSILDPSWNIVLVYTKKLEIIMTVRYLLLFWGIFPSVMLAIDAFELDSAPAPSIVVAYIGQLCVLLWFLKQLRPTPITEVIRMSDLTDKG